MSAILNLNFPHTLGRQVLLAFYIKRSMLKFTQIVIIIINNNNDNDDGMLYINTLEYGNVNEI